MAIGRGRVPITLANRETGLPIAGASVQINVRSSGSAATLYSGETGTGVVSNPATTDSSGRIAAWLNRGQYVAVISGTGLSNIAPEPFDVAPAGDKNIDTAWIDDNSVTGAKIPDGSIGPIELAAKAVTLDKLGTAIGGRILLAGVCNPFSPTPNTTQTIGAPWNVTHNNKRCLGLFFSIASNVGVTDANAAGGARHVLDGNVLSSYYGSGELIQPQHTISICGVVDLGVLSGVHSHNVRVEQGNTPAFFTNHGHSMLILWEEY